MSKKAERIYKATEAEIKNHIRKRIQYDCLNHMVTEELMPQRTVNDLMAIWNAKAKSLESASKRYQRDPEMADRWESLVDAYKLDVETLRRMYLTIQTAQKFIDELKAI